MESALLQDSHVGRAGPVIAAGRGRALFTVCVLAGPQCTVHREPVARIVLFVRTPFFAQVPGHKRSSLEKAAVTPLQIGVGEIPADGDWFPSLPISHLE